MKDDNDHFYFDSKSERDYALTERRTDIYNRTHQMSTT